MEIMTANRRISAASIIGNTVVREKWLSIGIILTVTGAVVISLLPPLVLGKIIDPDRRRKFPGIFHGSGVFSADLFVGGAGVLERKFPDCVWTEDDPCVPKRAFEEACPAER